MATFDEQISQALSRAMESLHKHLEADLTSLTTDLVTAADLARRQAATDAAEAAAAEVRRTADAAAAELRRTAAAAAADARRHAEQQITQLKDEARAQVADVRASHQTQMDEAKRVIKAKLDDAKRVADSEASTLRKKIVALEAELDLAKHQAKVDLDRAQREIEGLKQNTQTLAEDAVIAQLAEAEATGERRTIAEVERVRTDAQQAEIASTARLVSDIRAIDDARSLGDVLTALALSAGHEVERAAVLIVKGESLCGWRFAGFPPEMTQKPGAVVLARASGGLLGTVAAKAASDTVSPAMSADDSALPAFARGAGARHAVALPISVGGEVVAVLYADAVRSDVPSAACRWPSVIEVLARHASRTLEAATVRQAAGLPPAMRAMPISRKPLPGPVEIGGVSDDDAARRYARLLVSEIRMYHEPVIDAGRRSRDLRARLGGEIDRARRLYESRIPATVRQSADYFEQELVRTLADGDRSLLG